MDGDHPIEPLITDATIGARLRDARRAVNMSQAEVAMGLHRLGLRMHQTQVSAAEKGERPLRVTELVAFTRVLGIRPGTILADSSDELDPEVAAKVSSRLSEAMLLLQQSVAKAFVTKNDQN